MKINKYRMLEFFGNAVIQTFLIVAALTCLFPLFWMLRSSLMSLDTIFTDKSMIPAVINFNNYVTAWVSGGFGVYLWNSVFYTVVVVAGIVIVSSLAAFAFYRKTS